MNEEVAIRAINDATAALRAYDGTECFGHLCALLEALEQSYKGALVHVSGQELQIVQGAARQVIAMKSALTSQIEGLTPRI